MSATPGSLDEAQTGDGANSIPNEWYFVTPPQDVSWTKNSKSNEISTYGTNAPYLNYGSTSLRKLTLGNALVEGFSDGKEIEGNITQLESCMQMVIDSGSGYVSPYCWNVFAGNKSYGTFIITSVDVNEKMRDMSGKATRATVDIQLQEVSPLQVSSGTDLTSTPVISGITQESYDALNPPSEITSQEAKVAGSQTQRAGQQYLNPGTPPVSTPGDPNVVTNPVLSGTGTKPTIQQQNATRYEEAVRTGARF